MAPVKSENDDNKDNNERILPPYCVMRDDIVISGISGIFPDSYDLNELAKNLYDGVNCVSGRFPRWPPGFIGLPKFSGNIPTDLSEFDGQFFGYPKDEANSLEMHIRIMLEHTYSAILDAGYDPETFRGTNTGFFFSNYLGDNITILWNHNDNPYLQLQTERIPYAFDFRGPVSSVDVACASSLTAVHQAMVALRTGQCDQAIVATTNISTLPATAYYFVDLSMTSQECKCKVFDASADGYGRSEAIGALFLQKKRDAKRIYSIIRHSKTNCDGYKPEGITFPKVSTQETLIRDTYSECGIDTFKVKYAELHATGTKAGDPIECKSIAMAMRNGKPNHDGPLLIGALKSNIGHSEGASGFGAICKVIISYENKMIPKNINYKVPNPEIPELFDGTLLPITENTLFDGGIVTVNNFGFGGANAHIIVESPNIEPKDESFKIADKIPRLVLMCGRTMESVKHVFEYIKSNRSLITREFLSLINDISHQSRRNYRGMPFRGSMILHNNGENEPEFKIVESFSISDKQRPLWYIFTGMGSQWSKMVSSLMNCDFISKNVIELSRVLEPYDIDLVKLMTSDYTESLFRPIGCFVSIAAMQIIFVDLLTYLGLKPNGMIGYSIGEIGCAYADGAMTAEQTILEAYFRGKCVEECVNERGLMATVGLSYDEIKNRCPNGVVIGCNNSAESVTISGPHSIATKFIEELRKEKVFVKEVASCEIAFHSPAVNSIVQSLTNHLNSIGIKPKPRTERWISTSCDDSAHSDVMYYVNNLIKPVMFYEAIQRIPENACVIEISPHSLFGSSIKRTVGSDVKFISMMTKNGTIDTLLSSIGQLYGHGYDPLIEKLYPRVEYPVPRGTPFISPLIKWNHSDKHFVPEYEASIVKGEKLRKRWNIKLYERQFESLSGHMIDGRILYPATGYLFLVWKTLAYIMDVKYTQLPIQFENVTFKSATIMPKDREVTFEVHYFETSNKFEIVESGNVCVSGRAFVPNLSDSNGVLKFQNILNVENIRIKEKLIMQSKDVYKALRIRGCDYGPSFQGIQSATSDGCNGKIKWTGDWPAFVDSMLQISMLPQSNRNLYIPTNIELLRCDPRIMNIGENEKIIPVAFEPNTNIICAEGIEVKNVRTTKVSRKTKDDVTIEKYIFIPNNENMAIDNDLNVKINDYIVACHTIASEIEQNLRKTSKVSFGINNVKKYLSSDNDEYTIIKILNEIKQNVKLENHSVLIKKLMMENKYKIAYDTIFNDSINCNRMIQPLIDISLDNYTEKPFNILEVNFGCPIFVPNIIRRLFSIEKVQYNCIVAHPDKNVDIHASHTRVVEINLKNLNISDAVPFNSQGLIVFRDKSLCGYEELSYDPKSILKQLFDILNGNGFILAFFRYKNLPFDCLLCSDFIDYPKRFANFMENAKELGLITVCTKYDEISTAAVLLRKPQILVIEKRHSIVMNESYDWVEKYKKVHSNLKSNEQIWLMSNDKYSGIMGMVNCLRYEPRGEQIRCIYSEEITKDIVCPEILETNLMQNMKRDNEWGQMCHVTLDKNDFKLRETKHAYINVKSKGDLSSFSWFEAPHKYWPIIRKDNEILVNVYYSPLNFRDIMCASGRLSADAIPGYLSVDDGILGMEFSGKDENGNRVLGMVSGRGMATTVIAPDPDFLWSIPDDWTMEEACTVPCVYATVYYALFIRAKLKRGETVLIHAGSGGVGLSAIAVCLSLDCNVFTTVGTSEKKNFIKSKFPKLKDNQILNSRDTIFVLHILKLTNGHGVDVILNSLSEDKLLASVRCLAPNGRFCEIGKYDLSIDSPLDLTSLIRNKTFHGIVLDAFFDVKKLTPILKKQKKLINKYVTEGIANGVVKPLHRTIFEKERVEDAFRFMSTGKHMGKVVLKIRDENDPPNLTLTVMAHPRTFINPQKSIIITGGLGGFGLEVAQWLVERGARKLILTSRTGPRESYHYYAIERMKVMGADVRVWTGDSTSEMELEDLLKTANKMGPISGIFHLAMVLSDGLMENQTVESFTIAADSKILQAKHLDSLSRRLCLELDYFVVFSSMASGKGNAGQSNYGYGNSACERICELRRSDGLHGLAIQWGAIGDVGVFVDTMNTNKIGDILIQRIPSCMSVLDQLLHSDGAVYTSYIVDNERNESSDSSDKFLSQISRIMGINDLLQINPKSRLVEIGMDSLMGVEIKLALEKSFNVNLNTQEIRNLTIEDLINFQNTDSAAENITLVNDQINISNDMRQLPNDPIVHLNTIKLGKPIFVLPSVEGQFEVMTPVACNIMRPVYGLNWTKEFNKLSYLRSAASKWLQIMEEIEPMGEFDILGYSFGGVAAYEMSLQLQKRGRKVKNLVMLDSSPQLMAKIGSSAKSSESIKGFSNFKGFNNETLAHIQVLIIIMMRFKRIITDETMKILMNCNSFDERYKTAAKILKDNGIKSEEKEIIENLEAFWVKINMAEQYVNHDKYNGDIILIRASESKLLNRSEFTMKHDYGISNVITGNCDVTVLEGDHWSFIGNNIDQLSSIINKM